jgi:nicotinamidase-related amidase
MASIFPIRDPKTDALISPENSVLAVIDYQPVQIHSVNTENTGRMLKNLLAVCKAATVFNVPAVLTTVNVGTHRNQDTIPQIKEALPAGTASIDRTSMNSWEDDDFVAAIKATGRSKIIICALWTEVCMAFPTLDAMREGFEVYPVVDAIAGTTPLAHETALRRVERAGAQLITTPQLICELQRDWNRKETSEEFLNLMFEIGAFQGL